ncbi:MAG TPA: efflux transporter outer membrane subunit [Planctomycetota bacterium]|nr:efflux transporter outer membrane subunit [Planctomycetota bacterium]
MNHSHASKFVSVLALALLGCTAVGPDPEPPQADLPAAWRDSDQLPARPAELERWWERLDDPVLDALVERALGEGLDVRAALARVREARALRGVSAADRYPTVDAFGVYEHREESVTTPFGPFAPETDIHTLGFDATWEVDLWGRVRRSVEAADADLAANIEDARDVAVVVAAETARTYVELRAFQRRVEIALTNVSLQEQTLELVSAREGAGLVGQRDVAQAATNVEYTRSRVPALEVGLRAAENRLAVLLGRAPGALPEELARALAEPQPVPRAPLEFAVGVPADVLRRRADVRAAERRLAAEIARVGVAEGDLLPRLSLFGSLGLSSNGAADLFESDSVFSGFGPSLRWNVFDGGRLRNRVRAQDARSEQALVAWEGAVLVALEEAENAMTGFVREQVRRASLGLAAEQARLAVELAQTEYEAGLTDFQAVLASERALADLEDELAVSDSTVTTRMVALCKALGGGFEHEPLAAAVARAD